MDRHLYKLAGGKGGGGPVGRLVAGTGIGLGYEAQPQLGKTHVSTEVGQVEVAVPGTGLDQSLVQIADKRIVVTYGRHLNIFIGEEEEDGADPVPRQEGDVVPLAVTRRLHSVRTKAGELGKGTRPKDEGG